MTVNIQPRRIEHLSARMQMTTIANDERTILRLSRESLRGDQPAVRFVERLGGTGSQQRLPWRA